VAVAVDRAFKSIRHVVDIGEARRTGGLRGGKARTPLRQMKWMWWSGVNPAFFRLSAKAAFTSIVG